MRFRQAILRRLPLILSWPIVAESIGLHKTHVERARSTALGTELTLWIEPPHSVARVEMVSDLIAVAYGLARVRVIHDPLRADRVTLMLDSSLSIGSVPYPGEGNRVGLPLDPRRMMPIGVDDNGEVVRIRLLGHSVLIGGLPGSGKSLGCRTMLAGLAASRMFVLSALIPRGPN
jgi:hypothetical protein